MKSWLKQQVTELTAWAGGFILMSSIINLPFWINMIVGTTLLLSGDSKVKNYINKVSPTIVSKLG